MTPRTHRVLAAIAYALLVLAVAGMAVLMGSVLFEAISSMEASRD